jgi:hypothetical protein
MILRIATETRDIRSDVTRMSLRLRVLLEQQLHDFLMTFYRCRLQFIAILSI